MMLLVCSLLPVFSGLLSALGNLLSQILEARKKAKIGTPANEINVAGAARYAVFGWDLKLNSPFVTRESPKVLSRDWKMEKQNMSAIFVKVQEEQNALCCFCGKLALKWVCIFSVCLWCLCLLQDTYYRTSEPFRLPADGVVDAHHRSLLYSQAAAPGPLHICTRISASLLLCYEHPGSESTLFWL